MRIDGHGGTFMRLNPARIPVFVGLLTAVLVVALASSAVGLIWSMRTTAMRSAEGLADNMALGVEATLNRHLLSLDLLLSGVQEQLQVSNANDPQDDGRLLTMISRDNLLVGRLALLDAKGRVRAASGSSGSLQDFSWLFSRSCLVSGLMSRTNIRLNMESMTELSVK